MIELHLIGYTADLGRLVLDLAGADGGRYRLVVDEDLFATIDELREERRAAGLPVGDLVEYAEELGLDRDHLARLEDQDQQAAAAAGRVSAGSAAGARVLGTEPAVEAPVEPPGWDLDEGFDADGADSPAAADAADPDVPPGGWRPTPLPARRTTRPEVVEDDGARWRDDDEAGDGLVVRLLEQRASSAPATEDRGPDPERPTSPEPSPEPDLVPELDLRPEPDVAPEPAPELHEPLPPELEPAPPEPTPEPAPDDPDDPDTSGTIAVPPRPDGAHRQPPRPLAPESARRSPPVARPAPGPEPDAQPLPEAALSPAEIQARLRHGRSVRAVAREAGVDEAWIRRWEAPILAEQARVRDRALAARVHRPRLGRSAQPLGSAVASNLAARGVADQDVAWEVSRRRDGRWRVVARYVSRGRKRSATWIWDPEDDAVTPASDSARDLGFTRRRR